MNNNRRKQIKDLIIKVKYLKDEINKVLDDEQYAYDSMSEGLQCTERGFNSEESIEFLESAIENIDECINNLESIN